jgi:hypothetical protein
MEQQVEKEKNYNRDMQKLYNMIIKVDSMDQLTKEGWKIINKIRENRVDIDKKVSIISVLGNKNAGKSFILHLLTGKNIPNGYTVTTEGLSFIMPEEGDNRGDNYILIDTAGTESPLLLEKITKMTIDSINKMAKDRLITDYFLQKFILEKSDIFICVVDNLTLTDQKFINRIVNNYTNKTIFIIHNLKTFIEKNQVENYINNTLRQSLTFDLKQDKYYDIGNEPNFEENQIFFIQKLKDKERKVVHLIIANEDSDAGKYYNKSTINYLLIQLSQVKEKKPFNIIKNLKDFLVSFSEEIFNKKIEKSSVKIENDCIKIVDNKDLVLKECLNDVMGNIIIDNNYKPKYRYSYFLDSSTQERKFFIEIELFGIWNLFHKIEVKDNYFIIKISGEKKQKIIERNYEFKNYIPKSNFDLEIKVKNSLGIVSDEPPKTEEINGLYILIFSLKRKNIEEEIVSGESDENEDV